jgi:hypothetical protein
VIFLTRIEFVSEWVLDKNFIQNKVSNVKLDKWQNLQSALLLGHWTMHFLIFILCIASSAFLSGCGKTEFASFVQQPITISVFKDGRPVSERRVSPPSSEHERLASWLAKHQSGWHSSLITYAPGMLVSGTDFTMNVQHSRVIINAAGKQFVHDANDSDFQFLLHKPGT